MDCTLRWQSPPGDFTEGRYALDLALCLGRLVQCYPPCCVWAGLHKVSHSHKVSYTVYYYVLTSTLFSLPLTVPIPGSCAKGGRILAETKNATLDVVARD